LKNIIKLLSQNKSNDLKNDLLIFELKVEFEKRSKLFITFINELNKQIMFIINSFQLKYDLNEKIISFFRLNHKTFTDWFTRLRSNTINASLLLDCYSSVIYNSFVYLNDLKLKSLKEEKYYYEIESFLLKLIFKFSEKFDFEQIFGFMKWIKKLNYKDQNVCQRKEFTLKLIESIYHFSIEEFEISLKILNELISDKNFMEIFKLNDIFDKIIDLIMNLKIILKKDLNIFN
jgi:hypothetical protein